MMAWLSFDQSVVVIWNNWLHNLGFLGEWVKSIAVFGVYALPIVFVVWWFTTGHKGREYLLSGILSGLLGWQVFNNAWKLFIMRPRPDESLPIQELLFRRPDTSFPSDHSALLFGVAAFFWLQKERVSAGWLTLLAVSVGLARIATAVHYPTDIVVGFLDGFLAAVVVSHFHRYLCENVWSWVIGIARKLKLA